MAYRCDICDKGSYVANNVSHSHVKTKKLQKPNLQRVRAVVDGQTKKIKVCTRCLRSGKVIKANRTINSKYSGLKEG